MPAGMLIESIKGLTRSCSRTFHELGPGAVIGVSKRPLSLAGIKELTGNPNTDRLRWVRRARHLACSVADKGWICVRSELASPVRDLGSWVWRNAVVKPQVKLWVRVEEGEFKFKVPTTGVG